MLFVVGAMAALSIDVVTLYTARSEAQLAADAAALAAARVLANSGATSDTTGSSMASAWNLATAVALQVAEQNQVGGTNLTASQVTIPAAPGGTNTNPTVTISVQVTNLPTFFARIWGKTQLAVSASATAEAYNPSGASALGGTTTPVAPMCVKPWLLPNLDPSGVAPDIFNTTTGVIDATSLLGWSSVGTTQPLTDACTGGDCSTGLPTKVNPWQYFPGDPNTTFPPPTNSLPNCNPALTTNYQESVAGCIQIPISCSSPAGNPANIDMNPYPGSGRNPDTVAAVNCLTHATNNQGDQVDPAASVPPFQFLAGADNPIPGTAGKNVLVSDSLVTVPVFDSSGGVSSSVNIIGFVQLFLNPDGNAATGPVNTTVINLAGCGTNASGQPILGNGASPVAVRLISPP